MKSGDCDVIKHHKFNEVFFLNGVVNIKTSPLISYTHVVQFLLCCLHLLPLLSTSICYCPPVAEQWNCSIHRRINIYRFLPCFYLLFHRCFPSFFICPDVYTHKHDKHDVDKLLLPRTVALTCCFIGLLFDFLSVLTKTHVFFWDHATQFMSIGRRKSLRSLESFVKLGRERGLKGYFEFSGNSPRHFQPIREQNVRDARWYSPPV